MTCREYLPFNSFPCLCLIWFRTNFEDACHSDGIWSKQIKLNLLKFISCQTRIFQAFLEFIKNTKKFSTVSGFLDVRRIYKKDTYSLPKFRESKQEIIKKNWFDEIFFGESKFFIFTHCQMALVGWGGGRLF